MQHMDIQPVSYTHLDVYKRQMQETAKDGCTQSAVSGKQPVPVYQEFEKAA